MSKLLRNFVGNKRRQAQDYIESWQSTVYSIVVFSATMVVIFWASVFLYTSFYFTFMPQESITWPIHFQFRSCEDEPGICSNPNAVIPVLDPMRGSLLVRGQKYRVVVDLEMPESPVNQRIGMFLLNMEMKNQGGEMLRKSSRSAMLRYKSELLHIISTTVFAPLMLYGLQEEKQVVTVELFSQYEEDPLLPLSEVHIELASRHVELYAAQMRIHATFSGLRYFMYNYPLSAAGVGVGICMVFLSAVVILSWYQFSGPTLSPIQASRGLASFPNGSASTISALSSSPSPPPPVIRKVVEEEDKDGGGGGGGAPPSSRVFKVEPDEKSAKGEDKTVPSDSRSSEVSQDSAGGEKAGDREDFEIVTSSKPQGVTLKEEEEDEAFPSPKRSISSEEESVVRQRVQVIS